MSVLPDGPGLRVRWLAAVPLMVVSTALPLFGQLALNAWLAASAQVTDGPGPGFLDEFSDGVEDYGVAVAVPAVALVVFLVRRTMFAAWPMVCLWLSVWQLGPGTLFGSVLDREGALLPNLALGVGLTWLNYQLGRLTTWMLSRPVARDVALSELEIPYRVPGSRARLRVQRDRLLLDRLKSADRDVNKVIHWPELREARLSELHEPTTWRASPDTWIEVPAGPVLHVTSTNEEWLLPVAESTGEELAAAITLRVHNRT
jgi:hypothetical protein